MLSFKPVFEHTEEVMAKRRYRRGWTCKETEHQRGVLKLSLQGRWDKFVLPPVYFLHAHTQARLRGQDEEETRCTMSWRRALRLSGSGWEQKGPPHLLIPCAERQREQDGGCRGQG